MYPIFISDLPHPLDKSKKVSLLRVTPFFTLDAPQKGGNEINSDHINKDEDVHNLYIHKFLSSPSPLQQYNQLHAKAFWKGTKPKKKGENSVYGVLN